VRLYVDIDSDDVALVHLWCEWSARTDPDAPEEPFSPREVLHSAVAAAVHQAVESMQDELAAAGVKGMGDLDAAVRAAMGLAKGKEAKDVHLYGLPY
jgi:hypothetical protein